MSSADTDSNSVGDWSYLLREIRRRTLHPCSNVPFVFYVILAIVCLGGLGIWVELIKTQFSKAPTSYEGVLTAIATFYPALIGSASLQLILMSTGKSDKILVSFALLVCIISFLSVGIIGVFHQLHPVWSFKAASFFAVFAVWFWWFTNGDDLTYQNAPVDAAAGGDTDKALKGNLDDFKVND